MCVLRAVLKQDNVAHFLISRGRSFHINGPRYANEFLEISRLAYGKVNKLADVEFLVSLTATSLQIVMQSEIYVGLIAILSSYYSTRQENRNTSKNIQTKPQH